MKLPDYAKSLGISYKTAWRCWKAGKLPHPARQTETGLVIVDYTPNLVTPPSVTNRVAIYSRVSTSENKDNLERQADRLIQYSIAKGYQVVRVVKEIGSGLNDNRKKLEQLLIDGGYEREHPTLADIPVTILAEYRGRLNPPARNHDP